MPISEIQDLDEYGGIVMALRPAYSAFTITAWADAFYHFTYHFYVNKEVVINIEVFGKTLGGKIVDNPELADMIEPYFNYVGAITYDEKDGRMYFMGVKPTGPIIFQYQVGTMGELEALVNAHNKRTEEA